VALHSLADGGRAEGGRRRMGTYWLSGDTTPCRMTGSGDTTPCRMTGVTLHTGLYPQMRLLLAKGAPSTLTPLPPISPHVQWTSVLLSETLLAHDFYVCLERPSGALPPDSPAPGEGTPRIQPARLSRARTRCSTGI